MMIGGLTIAIGASLKNYYIFLIGETINLGGVGCWLTVSSTYLSIWFKNRETAFAISSDTFCCYLSNFAFAAIHPIVFNRFKSLAGNYWMTFLMASVAFCYGWLLCYLDSYAPPDQDEKKEGESDEGFSISTIKRLPAIVWILMGGQLTILQSFMLQDVMSGDLFQKIFGLTNEEAGIAIGIPSLVLGVFSIFTGLIIYRVGHKPHISNLPLIPNSVWHWNFHNTFRAINDHYSSRGSW